MNTSAPETYPIPSCSWRRAQQRPGDRFKIGPVVVEKYAIDLWDRQHLHSGFDGGPRPPRVDSDFMSIDAPETYLIPACS